MSHDPVKDALTALIDERIAAALSRAARPANDEYLTVAEYARRYAISESTVRTAIREGRLEHTRIGRAVRVPAAAKIGASAPDSATERARLKLLGGGKR